jgi:predicted metal-dependent HD superfamily phosphohydrolase
MNIRKIKNFVFHKLETELDNKLTYHGLGHTIYVLKSCNQYIKRMHIASYDAYLLRTAAIFHDTGFIWDFDNHEDESIKYASKILPDWNYSQTEINRIVGMIEATKKPQQPNNSLEEIMADSDLDYLGTDVFYKVGNKLYKELLAYKKISSVKEWDELQVDFLREHNYHTPFALKYREPVKQKYLKEILDKWGWK